MKTGLVSYDISINRYRTELSKILEIYAERVQFSVFEFDLNNTQFKELIEKIYLFYDEYINYCVAQGIQGIKSSIRVYVICESCKKNLLILGDDTKIEKSEDIII